MVQVDGGPPPEGEFAAEGTVLEALMVAHELHRQGQLDQAELLYERIDSADPDNPDVLHYLGVLRHQRGRSDEALRLIHRSIAIQPDQPSTYNNLGNILVEQGRAAEAAQAYRELLARLPEHAPGWNNLGAALRALGDFEDAERAYQHSLALDGQVAEVHNNFGNLLRAMGRLPDAIQSYFRALALSPRNKETRKLIGLAYSSLGELDAAADVYHEWLEEEPTSPVAQHMYAACSGIAVPARASNAYVETTFDGFAASFDAKLSNLEYQAPELVARALATWRAADASLVCLDAGCGTGLCGPLVRAHAKRLEGVDLSSGMLDRARFRGVYDALFKDELSHFILAHRATYDVIVSADTLVYFGDLASVFNAAFESLRADGRLIFTVESTGASDPASGYAIQPHGRYAHSSGYLEASLARAGFQKPAIETAVLRQEGGKPVAGWVVSVGRGARDPN